VCRLRYIVRQIARHFPAAERPAVDAWFHDGFLAHMSVPFWDSLGVPFGPNALHALVAVKEFESVLEQVKAGSIRSPSQLVRPLSLSFSVLTLPSTSMQHTADALVALQPEIGGAAHFPALHRLIAAFDRLVRRPLSSPLSLLPDLTPLLVARPQHPEHAEYSDAAVEKRKRRDGYGSSDDPAHGGLKRVRPLLLSLLLASFRSLAH